MSNDRNQNSAERWKTIDEANCKFTRYEVSNQGRVRSIRTVDGADFHYRLLKIEHDTRNDMNSGFVRLRVDGKNKKFYLSRLVARAFVPNPEGKPFVNHINGNQHDDRAENLMWSDTKYNGKEEREAYDIFVGTEQRPLACGVMAKSGLWAVHRWKKALSNILDFERTYGVLSYNRDCVYLNGQLITIRKVATTINGL